MKTKPRRLFRARRSGPALVIEEVADREPHYRACVDELLRRHADAIRAGVARGVQYGIEVLHDSWCPALKGGCCDCNCVVNLVVQHDPREDN